jgi:hypothetical protein
VKELKKALEERIREETRQQAGPNAAQENANKMAALAMLFQSVQNYLEMKNDPEESDECVETLEAVDTLVDGLKNTHAYLQDNKKNQGRSHVPSWTRIMIYLGPIFLSALCYLAFTTVRK